MSISETKSYEVVCDGRRVEITADMIGQGIDLVMDAKAGDITSGDAVRRIFSILLAGLSDPAPEPRDREPPQRSPSDFPA